MDGAVFPSENRSSTSSSASGDCDFLAANGSAPPNKETPPIGFFFVSFAAGATVGSAGFGVGSEKSSPSSLNRDSGCADLVFEPGLGVEAKRSSYREIKMFSFFVHESPCSYLLVRRR